MKKVILLVAVVVLIAGMFVVPAVAGKGGQAGKSNIAHVDLEVTPVAAADYPDASGRIKYNIEGDIDFVFNGHGLIPGEEYVLRAGPVLGTGVANGGGNVHIAGVVAGVSASDLTVRIRLRETAAGSLRVLRGTLVE